MMGFFKRIFRNEVSTTREPKDWFLDWIGGGSKTSAGINISAAKAMTFSSVYQAINLISGDIAKLPIQLNESLEPTGKRRASEHAAFYLMRRKASSELTAFYFKREMVRSALLHGNSYAYIFRDSGYRPTELRVLDASKTHPIREAGRLWYVTQVEQEWRKLDPANVFHLRGLASDGIMGYSFVEVAKESIGLGLASEQFGSMFFGNGTTPSGVLEYPMKLDDQVVKNIRRQWETLHKGIENSHSIAVLDRGVTFKPINLNLEQAQFLSTRVFQRQEIASWFNLPPHKLGDEARTSFASLEQENASYLQSTLEPWLLAFEEEAWDKLLSEKEKRDGRLSFEFNRAALLKPDTKSRFEVYGIAINSGLLSPNEARGMENLGPYDGGDEFVRPLNLSTVDQQPEEPAAEDSANSEVQDSHRQLLLSEIQRLVRWETDAVTRAVRKENFLASCEEFYAKHEATLAERLAPVLRCVSAVTGRKYSAESIAKDYCVRSFESILDLSGAIGSDELPSAIQNFISGWETEKPHLILDRVFEGEVING